MGQQNITLKVQDTASEPTLYKVTRGSHGTANQFNFTIKKADGSTYDLTGKTVKFLLYNFSRFPVFEKDVTLVTAASGTAKYVPADGDWYVKNLYFMRLSIYDSTNGKEFTEEVLFEVV